MQSNAIGFLRLFLALIVVFAHSFVLGGFPGKEAVEPFSIMAVGGFFSLSGYLLTASYLRLKSLPKYLWHRTLRIFPAYWVCLSLCAIALPLFYGLSPNGDYLIQNFILNQGQYRIPGLFHENPYPGVINGSLWTLGHEFRAYLILGIIGLLGLLKKYIVLSLIAISWLFILKLNSNFVAVQAPLLICHFLTGAFFYLKQVQISKQIAVLSIFLIAISCFMSNYFIVAPFFISALIFWFAANLPFKRFGTVNDYSYGIYIYAFPIQQLLANFGFNRWGLGAYFILSIACTVPLAIASWFLIEKPALKLKNWNNLPFQKSIL